MSNLEQWIRNILTEDAVNLSIGSVRNLQLVRSEFKRLHEENEELKKQISKIKPHHYERVTKKPPKKTPVVVVQKKTPVVVVPKDETFASLTYKALKVAKFLRQNYVTNQPPPL